MLVERCAYDRAVQIAKQVAETTAAAPSHLSGRHIGPVVSRQQWEKIQVHCGCELVSNSQRDRLHSLSLCVRVWLFERVYFYCALTSKQIERMQGYIQSGIDEGAQLLAGGLGLPDGVTKGYFVRPTVFADVKPGMTIEKEEIFGPVLCMMPFDDEAHAVRIANDTPYGLTNYVRRKLRYPFSV